MATDGAGNQVWEDFSSVTGSVTVVRPDGSAEVWPKTAVPTAPTRPPYRGATLDEVMHSEHDLLGRQFLAGDADPDYDEVADALPPIRRMPQYAFLGSGHNADTVSVEYGGRSTNFDPAIVQPGIAAVRARSEVLDGLVGGWLPVVRFVYPDGPDWWEYVAFAPVDPDHPTVQRAWHRVVRVEGGRPVRVDYVDTYPPAPPRDGTDDPKGFYDDLLALAGHWRAVLAPAPEIDIPDRRLADQAKHSLVRARMTRIGDFPRYGVLDRMYAGAEHDGFQDTFNADVTACVLWGLLDQARRYIDNYFTHFVRDDGSLWYRGPETGQYGRMLTVVAEYARVSGDGAVLSDHAVRLRAICDLLVGLHRQARTLDEADAAYGVIRGWSEADSCLEADPDRYRQPYLSNSAEAARGLLSLADAIRGVGDPALAPWAEGLEASGAAIRDDLDRAIARSLLPEAACLPVVAGAREPYHVAVGADVADPQFRAYRANMELLFSGVLDAGTVATIVDYREAHRDLVLGMPCAYGMVHGPALEANSPELAGFLSYGHAYGLLQHGRIREFLLCLYALSAHQYTRGTWTAPETRLVDPDRDCIGYAVPAQLTVPMLLRWALVFEEPLDNRLHLAPAVPRSWLTDGKRVAVGGVRTRWGAVDLTIESEVAHGRVRVRVARQDASVDTTLHLRLPDGLHIANVLVDGAPCARWDAAAETVALPPDRAVVELLVLTA
jgi:hypothetical protein